MKLTLCGSARFEREFHEWNEKLTLAGHTVYGLAVLPSFKGAKDWYSPHQKTLLDLLHLSKIEESDGIVVLDVGGYVGESTQREITWARIRKKGVWWLEGDASERRIHHDLPAEVLLHPPLGVAVPVLKVPVSDLVAVSIPRAL